MKVFHTGDGQSVGSMSEVQQDVDKKGRVAKVGVGTVGKVWEEGQVDSMWEG